MNLVKYISILLLVLSSVKAHAQDIYEWIELDTLVLKVNKDFNTEDFIGLVQKDSTFYKAFKNLSYFPHTSTTTINVLNTENKEKAKVKRESDHFHRNDSSWTVIKSDAVTGKYYKKNGSNKYYTGAMFDKVFFETDTNYMPNNYVSSNYEQKKWDNRSDKHYEQLKRFVFSPGGEVKGVPIIGKKLEIFSPKLRPYYDYKISLVNFQGSSCYKFTCRKKEYVKDDKVVIQFLHSYFDRKTMSVIGRDYLIKHNTALFDFEIFISVKMKRDKQNNYLPTKMVYNGWWKLPLKSAEVLEVNMSNDYPQLK